MANKRYTTKTLARVACARTMLAFAVMSALLFLPAGTVRYWEAWVYLAILVSSATLILAYLLKNSPDLLERRMRMREKEPRQRWIIGLAWVWFAVTYVVPGFDKRWGGTDVPVPVVIAAELLVLLGYGVIFWVFRENRYASRIIEVEQDQPVVSTGPYALIRHPLYFGALLTYLFTPLALGSYWALVPAVFIIPIVVARIRNEERVLISRLPGYLGYVRRTRYRLVPGIW